VFGRETWSARGEGFAILFELFARIAPLATRHGRVRLRLPFTGLAGSEPVVEASDVASAVDIRSAVAALTPRQRTAVVLRYFEDLDLHTTALIMGCSPGTAKKLTARGLSVLRAALDIEFDASGGRDD